MPARIRSIHPDQWSDPEFVGLSASARLLTLGLRNFADDLGVFEWVPLKLRHWVLGFDPIDIDALLAELVDKQQVLTFTVKGKTYGAIRNFLKFQSPDRPTLTYPLPEGSQQTEVLEWVGVLHASVAWLERVKLQKGSIHNLNWTALVIRAKELGLTSLGADVCVDLSCEITASGDEMSYLDMSDPDIADAFIAEGHAAALAVQKRKNKHLQKKIGEHSASTLAGEGEGEGRGEGHKPPLPPKGELPVKRSGRRGRGLPYSVEDVRLAYNEIIAAINHPAQFRVPSVKRSAVSSKTRGHIEQRFAEYPEELKDMTAVRSLFAQITRTKFLMGLVKPREGMRPFAVDFQWIWWPGNFEKIIDRYYESNDGFMGLGEAPWDSTDDNSQEAA